MTRGMDQRNRDVNWKTVADDNCYKHEQHYRRASLAVLMDLRDELRRIRQVFECPNMLEVPHILRQIRRNTTKPAKKKPREKK